MDDGSFSKSKRKIILCTNSYSNTDVLHLINILLNKLSCGLISYSKKKQNIYYRIRINKSSMPILNKLVRPFIIPSMLYKLGKI